MRRNRCFQAPSEIQQMADDPKHEHADVVIQLQNQNSGFVRDIQFDIGGGTGPCDSRCTNSRGE